MADLEFSRDDILSLIGKISTLQPDLSDQEFQLLMSIFALAAEHVMPVAEPETVALPEAAAPGQQDGDAPATVTLPEAVAPGQQDGGAPATADELQRQLLQAYIPGSSFDSATEGVSLYGIGRGFGPH